MALPAIVHWLGRHPLSADTVSVLRAIHGPMLRIVHDPRRLLDRWSIVDYLREHPGHFVYVPYDLNQCAVAANRGRWFGALRYHDADHPMTGQLSEVYHYRRGRCEVRWTDPHPPTVPPRTEPITLQLSLFTSPHGQ